MVRIPQEIFHKLKKVLKEKGYDTNVGTDGVYYVKGKESLAFLKLANDVMNVVQEAGYGDDVEILTVNSYGFWTTADFLRIPGGNIFDKKEGVTLYARKKFFILRLSDYSTVQALVEDVVKRQAKGEEVALALEENETADDTIVHLSIALGVPLMYSAGVNPESKDIIKRNKELVEKAELKGRIKKPAYNPELPLSAITNASAIEVVDGNGYSAVHIDIWLNSGKRVSTQMGPGGEAEFGDFHITRWIESINKFLSEMIVEEIKQHQAKGGSILEDRMEGMIQEAIYSGLHIIELALTRAAAEASGKPLYAYLRENMVAPVMSRAAAPRRSADVDEAI